MSKFIKAFKNYVYDVHGLTGGGLILIYVVGVLLTTITIAYMCEH